MAYYNPVDTAPASPLLGEYRLPDVQPNHTKTLGQHEFLMLLMAQLQNQDPTAPLENVDMVTQMTQFATLDSINAMAAATQQQQAFSLIGKTIHASVSGREFFGSVDGAGFASGRAFVMVGDTRVYVSDIEQVFDNVYVADDARGIAAATSTVGKYIRADIGTSDAPSYIEGKVTRWMTDAGVVFVTVNGYDISLHQVIAVADTAEGLGSRPEAPDAPPPAESNGQGEHVTPPAQPEE